MVLYVALNMYKYIIIFKAEVRCSFDITTVGEQHPKSQYKGANDAKATGGKGTVRTGDRQHPVL